MVICSVSEKRLFLKKKEKKKVSQSKVVFTKHAAYLHPRIKVVILVPKLTMIENIRNSLLYYIKKTLFWDGLWVYESLLVNLSLLCLH